MQSIWRNYYYIAGLCNKYFGAIYYFTFSEYNIDYVTVAVLRITFLINPHLITDITTPKILGNNRHICIIAERARHVKGGCRGSRSFYPLHDCEFLLLRQSVGKEYL